MVIKGIYATKSALDTAELSGAKKNDSYMVGSGTPYTIYTYDGSAFKKGEQISNEAKDLSDTPVADVFEMKFKGEDGKMVMIRKGLHLGEIHFYRPTEDY